MQWSYQCPKCQAMLNPEQSVILRASREGETILLGLHPEPGNYQLYVPPGVEIKKGEKWSFQCPVCRQDLATEEDENLCEVVQKVEGKSRRILFSRIAGEQVTLVVSGTDIQEKHGVDAEKYLHPFTQIRY